MQKKLEFEKADDVKKKIISIIQALDFKHIDEQRIFCVRSTGSKTRAYARVWGLSKIFQFAAELPVTYVIEVLSHYYDTLSEDEKTKVLIHELMHIPKTFSGALLSHRGKHHRIDKRTVEKLFKQLFFVRV